MIGDILFTIAVFAAGTHIGHKYGGPLAVYAKAKSLLRSLKG